MRLKRAKGYQNIRGGGPGVVWLVCGDDSSFCPAWRVGSRELLQTFVVVATKVRSVGGVCGAV